LGDRKGIRPVKNWVVGYWHGYLSGARCRLAYGPADATATHSLASVKSRLVVPFWYRLIRVVPEKGAVCMLNVIVSMCSVIFFQQYNVAGDLLLFCCGNVCRWSGWSDTSVGHEWAIQSCASVSSSFLLTVTFHICGLQCCDAVGWAAARASGL